MVSGIGCNAYFSPPSVEIARSVELLVKYELEHIVNGSQDRPVSPFLVRNQ